MKLVGKLALLSTLALSTPAWAALQSGEAPEAATSSQDLVQLAQARDAEVYIDEDGNQVIVDIRTGQVISVRPPERRARQDNRRQRQYERRRQWQDDGYYRDDEIERYERRRRYDSEPEYTERAPREEFYPYEEEPAPRRRAEREAFPEPAQPRQVEQPRQAAKPKPKPTPRPTELAEREPVEREVITGATPTVSGKPEIVDVNKGRAGKSIVELGGEPEAKPTISPPVQSSVREDVASLQILLDRYGASPGVIDGRFGSNVDKAIINFRAITGKNLRSTDTAMIKELLASGGPAFIEYTITAQDAAGPYVASVPEDYGEKAKLDRLSYTSVPEALAERFHMDEAYLKALNAGANFNRPGTIIRVANVGEYVTKPVARIVADKGNKQVRAYGVDGKLVVAYPATIGSADTPSPSGVHAVSRIAFNPGYTYNPKINFKQGDNDKVLSIPPGPNGPVGSIWIALDKPTYGIHGTPEPSKIGKTESHGCVRLTNWDAGELAKLVKPGVKVEFVE